jgi:hypothetical protein
MTDMKNGLYQVRFKYPKEQQNIKVDIHYQDESSKLVPIRGSPFTCGFKAGVNAKNNELTGPQMVGTVSN